MNASRRSLAAMMFLPIGAQASNVIFNFQINWFDGPLMGTLSTGSFSYDSSIVIPGDLPGHPVVRPDVLSSFSMDVRGVHFSTPSVTSPLAFFGPSGELTAIQLGTSCSVVEGPPGFQWGSCSVLPWDSNSFVFNYIAGNPDAVASIGTDSTVATAVLSHGAITVSPVPELPVQLLFALGLPALFAIYQRRIKIFRRPPSIPAR